MAWDNMVDRSVGPMRVSLGIKFATPRLVISIEDYKVQRFLKILQSTWAEKRKSFTAIDAAISHETFASLYANQAKSPFGPGPLADQGVAITALYHAFRSSSQPKSNGTLLLEVENIFQVP